MHRGYIKLWRRSIESWVFHNADRWKVWSYCLMKANHTDTTATWGRVSSPIKVMRGQFITGRFALHEGCYPDGRKNEPSPSKVWRILKSLEKAGKVNIETNSQFSIVTICQYGIYQTVGSESEQQVEHQVNSERTASEQQVNTDKNAKKVKNAKKEKKKQALDVPIPESLDNPKFKATWEDFLERRKELKSPVTALAAIRLLKQCKDWGTDKSIELMDKSIAYGWKGLFEGDSGNSSKKRAPFDAAKLLKHGGLGND